MKYRTKLPLIAAGVFALSAVPAAAAIVTNDLNLRDGPGTGFGIITAMPAGAEVNVGGCTGNWCQVSWGDFEGYASASYLAGEGLQASTLVPAPAPTYRYSYRTYYDDPDYWGYRYYDRPGVSFRLSMLERDADRRRFAYREY